VVHLEEKMPYLEQFIAAVGKAVFGSNESLPLTDLFYLETKDGRFFFDSKPNSLVYFSWCGRASSRLDGFDESNRTLSLGSAREAVKRIAKKAKKALLILSLAGHLEENQIQIVSQFLVIDDEATYCLCQLATDFKYPFIPLFTIKGFCFSHTLMEEMFFLVSLLFLRLSYSAGR